jgi:hypothetical protein
MKARLIVARAEAVAYPMGWAPILDVGQEVRRLRAGFETVIRLCTRSRMMGWVLCASLWISSLLVIWMSVGWMGMFLSGHLLSAGTYWMKGLARRTPAVVRGSKGADARAAHVERA